MNRNSKMVVAALVAALVAVLGFVVVRQVDQREQADAGRRSSSVHRENATVDPANPPGAQSTSQTPTDAPQDGSTLMESSESSQDRATVPPEQRTPSTWEAGTPGHPAVEFVKAYNSMSYTDATPVEWVSRAAAWTTQAFAARFLDPIASNGSTDSPSWVQMKRDKESVRTVGLQVERATTSTGDKQTFNVSFKLRRTVNGKSHTSQVPTSYNVEVTKVGEKWLVSNLTTAATM